MIAIWQLYVDPHSKKKKKLKTESQDMYIIFEYIETDLHTVIRAAICEEIQK